MNFNKIKKRKNKIKKKDVDVTFFYNILIPPAATLAIFVG